MTQGTYLDIGGRSTYFPPFVNERFGKRPYWACTFASLLNGANVGWLGQQEASPDEVLKLAHASQDRTLRSGASSSYMVTAMQVLYGKKIAINHFDRDRVQEKLQTGWALVAGIWYAELPDRNKVWSKKFNKGHRVVVIGWDHGRTRLLDPMVDKDQTYTGQWIAWKDFEKAWWSGEQVWFKEGQYLPRPKQAATPTDRTRWNVRGGTLIVGYSPDDPRTVVKKARVSRDSGAHFDRLVDVTPAAA